jgi:sterol desaturase/sphingolipid hydroxylase (fatty acid hydroxylase superfamily)
MLERLAAALNVHLHSIYAFLFIYSFYQITSYTLQLYYYYLQRDRVSDWKCQPNAPPLPGKQDAGWIPWLPIFEPFGYKKPGAGRFPYGWILSMINMVVGSLCAAVATEGVMRGKSSLLFDDFQWARDCIGFFLACTLEQVAEYWWHRGMHSATLYSFCHRVHHANRAPSPFDGIVIHFILCFLVSFLSWLSNRIIFSSHRYVDSSIRGIRLLLYSLFSRVPGLDALVLHVWLHGNHGIVRRYRSLGYQIPRARYL